MKVALYETLNTESRDTIICEVDDWMENSETYIRVSDSINIPFVMISDSIIIPKKIEAIRAEKGLTMARYDKRISILLAIEHKPEVE